MKGQKILDLYHKAVRDVEDIHGTPGGEIGNGLRARGYVVRYDGGSVCNFDVFGKDLSFTADCCLERGWEVRNYIGIGPWKEDWSHCFREKDIDPSKYYDVPDMPSYAEMLESGQLKVKSFEVILKGGRGIERKGTFDDFEKADAFARKLCQEQIDVCNKDSVWRRYSSSSVKNDALRARERCELRHYEYYNYQDHRYWVVVDAADFDIERSKK